MSERTTTKERESQTDGLEEEIARAGQRVRRAGVEATFRATVEQRLRSLETEVAEVKTRLNGLLFFIVTTVLGQALLRLLA